MEHSYCGIMWCQLSERLSIIQETLNVMKQTFGTDVGYIGWKKVPGRLNIFVLRFQNLQPAVIYRLTWSTHDQGMNRPAGGCVEASAIIQI